MTGHVLVTGAGGFIGRRLAARLKELGREVRGADREKPAGRDASSDEFLRLDLRERAACEQAVDGVDRVYHLAADTRRPGPRGASHACVCRSNTLMNLHMLEAAAAAGVERFLLVSSTAVYPTPSDDGSTPESLGEEDAWPADPEPGLGEEKLYAERLCAHYRQDGGLDTGVARLQAVYGPGGPYEGARAPTPATLCRRVALTEEGGTIVLWGDGRRSGSYLYVDDGVEGLIRIMRSNRPGPLNLGTNRPVTVDEIVETILGIAGRDVAVEYDLGKPGRPSGRRLDLTRLRDALGWTPRTGVAEGLAETYPWIEERVRDAAGAYRHPGPPHIP